MEVTSDMLYKVGAMLGRKLSFPECVGRKRIVKIRAISRANSKICFESPLSLSVAVGRILLLEGMVVTVSCPRISEYNAEKMRRARE